jgi:hypothetical protein
MKAKVKLCQLHSEKIINRGLGFMVQVYNKKRDSREQREKKVGESLDSLKRKGRPGKRLSKKVNRLRWICILICVEE